MENEPMFDPKELRSMQIQAVEYCLKQDLLTAKIQYRDRLRRLDYQKIKYVTRDCNLILNVGHGVVPFCFMEN